MHAYLLSNLLSLLEVRRFMIRFVDTLHQNSLILEYITTNLHVDKKLQHNAFLFLKILPFKAIAFSAFKEE
jgi:hypothetical protein